MKEAKRSFVPAILLFALLLGQSSASDFYVTNNTELQNALNAARVNGYNDTIYIQQGYYDAIGPFTYGTASNDGMAVTLSAGWDANFAAQAEDPTATRLNGNGANPVLKLLANAPGAYITFTIENLTIEDGYASGPDDNGAGLCAYTGQAGDGSINLTIRNCLFRNNWAANGRFGGGIFCNGSVQIRNTSFLSNNASSGGAIYITYDPDRGQSVKPLLDHCYFEDNTNYGANGSSIWHNVALQVRKCTFKGRLDGLSSSGTGGAIYCGSGSNLNITNSIFTSIITKGSGSAIRCSDSTMTITNCLFTYNYAGLGVSDGYGAIAYDYRDGDPRLFKTVNITNCTFINNSTSVANAAAIYNHGATMNLTNSIFWDNDNTTGIWNPYGFVNMHYCLRADADWQGIINHSNNVIADPLLDPDNYFPSSKSPCIDRGDNTALPADSHDLDNDGNITEITPVDLKGQPRFYDDPCSPDLGIPTAPFADIGAYEYKPLNDTIKWMEITKGVNYGEPTTLNPLHEFNLTIHTDNTVQSLYFEKSRLGSVEIPNEPNTQSGYIQTFHSVEDSVQIWEYLVSDQDPNILNMYSEGTYTFTVGYEDASRQSTELWFGQPGSRQPLPKPLPKPVIISPEHGARTLSPATFLWEDANKPIITTDPNGEPNDCILTNVNLVYLMLEEVNGNQMDAALPPDATTYGPVLLEPNDWKFNLDLFYWLQGTNADNIDFGVGKYNHRAHHFKLVEPDFGTFGNRRNVKYTRDDCFGVPVTFSISGPGYGGIITSDCNFSKIVLHGTSEQSKFTITSKYPISIGDIVVNGPLKSIIAKTTNIRGDITLAGSLGILVLNDVADSHTINIGPSANPKAGVMMKFGRVSDLTIDSNIPIKTLQATEYIGGAIKAPWLGSISIKGNSKWGIRGDCNVNMNLSGTGAPKDVTLKIARIAGKITGGKWQINGHCKTIQMASSNPAFEMSLSGNLDTIKARGNKKFGITPILSGKWMCNSIKSISAEEIYQATLTMNQQPHEKIYAINKLTAKERIVNSRILSKGNIGMITTRAIEDSSCFAGDIAAGDLNGDGVLDLPSPFQMNYAEPATIKSLKITGLRGWQQNCFTNTNIAAARILNAYLAYPKIDNGGTWFGITADYIKALKIKNTNRILSWKNLDKPGDSIDSEEFKDAKIRIYE